MKQTDFIKKINKENRKYQIAKFTSYLQMMLSFGEKRKQRRWSYSIFEKDFPFDRNNNSLSESKYFKPTDIIVYDLIQKGDLPKVKKGLDKLFRKCYSHKFLGGSGSEDNIDNLINGLDQTLHSGNSWYNIGLFDFAYNEEIESYIDYFQICFHNFSSSYTAIEMRIVLAEKFVNEISCFIREQYKKPGMSIHRHWGKNRKKSGAKISYGISSGVQSECAKSQIVYEQLQYVKKKFLKKIANYFPLLQYSKYKDVFGLNVFETNITPSDRLEESVYSGLGLNEMHGFFMSEAERLYICTETMRSEDGYESEMMFIYNPNLISDYSIYMTPHNMVLTQLTMDYLLEIYRVVLLKDIGIRYRNLISRYRNRINKCKINKRQHKKLLKIQYQLNQDFYDFKKIDEELPVIDELQRAEKLLQENEYVKRSVYNGFHPYKLFVGTPKWIWEQVRANYSEVENDLVRKIEISDSLAKYSNELTNRRMVFAQVIIAIMTFILLIFPHKAIELANIIKWIWRRLTMFLI